VGSDVADSYHTLPRPASPATHYAHSPSAPHYLPASPTAFCPATTCLLHTACTPAARIPLPRLLPHTAPSPTASLTTSYLRAHIPACHTGTLHRPAAPFTYLTYPTATTPLHLHTCLPHYHPLGTFHSGHFNSFFTHLHKRMQNTTTYPTPVAFPTLNTSSSRSLLSDM